MKSSALYKSSPLLSLSLSFSTRKRKGRKKKRRKERSCFLVSATSTDMSFIDPFQPVVLSHPRLPLTAHVLPLGLNITRLIFRNPSTGETHDVIASPEDPKDHWTKGRTFIGPLVGRYANRLPVGKSQFAGGEIDIPEFCENQSVGYR